MFRELKIVKKTQPGGKNENCVIAPQMKNVAPFSIECKRSFGKNVASSRTASRNTREDVEGAKRTKRIFNVRMPKT